MAGHNKWSKVKHKKGAADAKKSKVWTKIIREVTLATRLGGADPQNNPRLRKALDDARWANMTKDTVQRAIVKGSSGVEGENMEELAYEGYGPGGVALLVECMTDNRNRTYGEVRTIFNKRGGNLGATGSVRFGFKKKGQLLFEKVPEDGKPISEEQLLDVGLAAGVTDITEAPDSFLVWCEPEDYLTLKDTYEKAGLMASASELTMVPDNPVHVTGSEAKALLGLIDALEDLDDVQNVWSNMDISDQELEQLTA